MNTRSACEVIAKARGEALLVATMGAMFAFDSLNAAQPRVSSVPLMGGAASLGLGLALAQPDRKVVVVDGDASLLMQLGGLVTVAEHQPRNFTHFVIHNGTQFSGGANLAIPGEGSVDLSGLARAAGYVGAECFDDLDIFNAEIDRLLVTPGPLLVELKVQPEPPRFSHENPQQEMPDRQFQRMGDEAQKLTAWLEAK